MKCTIGQMGKKQTKKNKQKKKERNLLNNNYFVITFKKYENVASARESGIDFK